MRKSKPAESSEAQAIVRRHFEWLQQFWTPNRESYAGHAGLIEDSELRKAYEVHDPELPGFVAAAIRVFAAKQLA